MKSEKIARELTNIKNTIEEAKRKKIQFEGRLSDLMEELEADYGCKSISEAKKKLNKMKEKLEIDKAELLSKTETLINTFNKNENNV